MQFLLLLLAAGAGTDEAGFTSLFNGKDLTGWVIENEGRFSVKDGTIFLDRGEGWLRSEKQYRDFELRLDFRFVSQRADGGIFIRAAREGKNWPIKHYQVQTMDNESIAAVFTRGLPRPKSTRDADAMRKVRDTQGGWQSYAILVHGERIEVRLNGALITTATGLARQPGYIGLQGEAGEVAFKNIRIRLSK